MNRLKYVQTHVPVHSVVAVVEPEPVKKLQLHKVAIILVKFSHISTIYTQRKNRYTFKKHLIIGFSFQNCILYTQIERKIGTLNKNTKLLSLVFKTAFFTQTCVTKNVLSGAGAGSRSR